MANKASTNTITSLRHSHPVPAVLLHDARIVGAGAVYGKGEYVGVRVGLRDGRDVMGALEGELVTHICTMALRTVTSSVLVWSSRWGRDGGGSGSRCC